MNALLAKIWRLPALVATEMARRAKIAGDWRGAARRYRAALACDPQNATTLLQYGNALRECGALHDAEEAYRRSLCLDPGVPDAHLQLGHALKLQRRFSDAVAAYRRAIELDPLLNDASLELLALGHTNHVARSAVPPASPIGPPAGEADSTPQRPLIVFDASDLLGHLEHSRSATGIQRVQIGVIANLLRTPDPEFEFAIGYFREHPEEFTAVPKNLFLCLTEFLQPSPGLPELSWQQAVQQLIALRVHGEPLEFRDGAALINLGTSWTRANYFLAIRTIKSRYRVLYVPFVHDCIPALFPELCAPQTVRDYLGWAAGVFRHADGFLVNSSTTARDLVRIGAVVGSSVAAPRRVALDARFQSDRVGSPGGDVTAMGRRRKEPYVLFVGSLELRKNHRAAFRAWSELIERRGRRNVPVLVCVGGPGWQSDATMRLLQSNWALRSRVRILSGVSDAALDGLYRDCLFTLYPSLYEGWGLPVTESLSYGKLPLVAAVPALRESGGELAEYFDPAMDGDLVAKLQQLIDDKPYLLRREADIRLGFTGRRWREVAQDILDWVRPMLASGPSGATFHAARIEIGRYYPMARNNAMRLGPELASGEAYRIGEGWWAPEEWGCWLKAGGAELALRVSGDIDEPWLELDIEGNPARASEVTVAAGGRAPTVATRMAPRERRRIAIRLASAGISGCLTSISIDVRGSCPLGETSGLGQRVVSIGMHGFTLVPNVSVEATSVATRLCAAIPG